MNSPREATLQWGKARDIDWRAVLDGELVANSYYLKTALTRKADLAKLLAKHAKIVGPNSPATSAVPETHVIDLDDSDDSDNESSSLPAWFATTGGAWVLKRSESNRGEDIFFVRSESPEDRLEAERLLAADRGGESPWVLQRYIKRPMLVDGDFKFHLRVMVLAIDDLRVFVHDAAVALCAAERFGEEDGVDLSNKFAHATNHCVQKKHGGDGKTTESNSFTIDELCERVRLPKDSPTAAALSECIRNQIDAVVKDLFFAARSRASPAVGFFPMAGSFELFGLDFIVDEDGKVWLLEVNSDPSLAVFGERLKPLCSDLIVDVVRVVSGDTNKVDGGFRLVLELPPRFPDATEARRRVSKLVSIVGSFTAGTYDEHEGGKKVASIAIGAPGAKGAAKALAAREDWEVTTNPNAPLCSLQWAPHRTVRWERVMEESPATRLVASHHYARAGLLRRVELFSALASAGAIGSMPATLTLTKKGVAAAGEDAAAALETAAGGACRWRLRQGGPVVICPSAADVVRRISGGDETRRWSVVQQIEGSVMELRATVLVAGSLHVGLHRNISGLGESLDAEEAFGIRRAAADVLSVAINAATKNRKCFLPFPNCFEVFTASLLAVRDRGHWKAWLLGFEDTFAEDSGGFDDCLAEDVVSAAIAFFFEAGWEPKSGFETIAIAGHRDS